MADSSAKSSRPRRSGALMIDLQRRMRCISGFLRLFHGHAAAPSRKHLDAVLRATEAPLAGTDRREHPNGQHEDGSQIGDGGDERSSPVRKKLDCTIHEIDLIRVEDDGEEEDGREESEAPEEEERGRGGEQSNPWRKRGRHSSEMESIDLLLFSSSSAPAVVSRLHRSNSSPEQRSSRRSNGFSANHILYQSRSPLLLQGRRSSALCTEKNDVRGDFRSKQSPSSPCSSIRDSSTNLFSSISTATNPTSTITSTATTIFTNPNVNGSSERRSSSSEPSLSSSSATLFINENQKRRPTIFAEWKKSLKMLSTKLGSERNVENTQEMPHGNTTPHRRSPDLNTRSSSHGITSPYLRNSDLNARSPSPSSVASSRPNNPVRIHDASNNSTYGTFNTLPNYHHQFSSSPLPSPSSAGRVSSSFSCFEPSKDANRLSIASNRSLDHNNNSNCRNNGGMQAPRFSLDDRELLLMQSGFCYRCNLRLRNHLYHHHLRQQHLHRSREILNSNYCSCSSASPSNPRNSIMAPRLDGLPTLFRSKSDREYSIANSSCNQMTLEQQKKQKKNQNKLMTMLLMKKKKKTAMDDGTEQVKCSDDLSPCPSPTPSSSSSFVSALMANSVSAGSPSICSVSPSSSFSSSSLSSSSSLTQKLLHTVAQGSFIKIHHNPPQSPPASPSFPAGSPSHGYGGSRLLQPKKQIRDGLPPIVILKQQKQSVLYPSKIHGNNSSLQRFKGLDSMRKMIRNSRTDLSENRDSRKPERKTLKQILEAMEKKGLLVPQPYAIEPRKSESGHHQLATDHIGMKAKGVRSHNYCSADRIVIMKPLTDGTSHEKKTTTKKKKEHTTKKKTQKKERKKMMVMKKKKMEIMRINKKQKKQKKKKKMKKKKKQERANHDLQQNQTSLIYKLPLLSSPPPPSSASSSSGAAAASDDQIKQSSIKLPFLSSSSQSQSSSSSSSPVSVLDKLELADGTNDSDKEEEEGTEIEEKDVSVIRNKYRNAEDEENNATAVVITEEWSRESCRATDDNRTTASSMQKSPHLSRLPSVVYSSSSLRIVSEELRSNREFLYTEHVLKASGFMAESEASCDTRSCSTIDEFVMAARWLEGQHHHHHHRIIEDHSKRAIVGSKVYDELERYWEDVADKQLAAEQEGQECGRDMGGELYRKSREMAMRRRLLFDCVNEVLGGIVRALVKEAIAMEPAGYGRCSGSRDQNTRRWRRRRSSNSSEFVTDAVSVWRRIEAMASSEYQKQAMQQQMHKWKKKTKKKEEEEEEEREEDMEELLHLLMAMNMKQEEEGPGDGDGDGGDEDDDDEVVAIVAAAVEGEILDSIVLDLLT